MRTYSGDRLALVLFGKAKRGILARLFGSPDKRFFVRELARALKMTPSTLTRDLAALTDAGVIVRTEDGRQVYYQANRASPVFEDLKGLVTKTFGIADIVRNMLSPVEDKLTLAAIYGSVARGEHLAGSDVDLLLVGEVQAGDFAEELTEAERALGRAINPTIFPVQEFRKGLKTNHFLQSVAKRPMVFLIGDKHELERIGKGQASNAR